MVLYEGKSIAFGPCQEIFARVQSAAVQTVARRQAGSAAKANGARRAPVAENVQS
jgi:ATP-binding cassette, subfamily C, bacterial PrsD